VTTAGTTDNPDDRPVGADRPDVADEVSRLTEALAGWWTSVTTGSPARPGPSASSAAPDSMDPHDTDPGGTDVERPPRADGEGRPAPDGHTREERPSASCCVCPVCRALDIARGARPDLLEKVALAAETVALLLREAAHDRGAAPADRPAPDEAARADPLRRGTPIVVTDGDEPSTARDEQQEGHAAWG
jgi:hypothetical protein